LLQITDGQYNIAAYLTKDALSQYMTNKANTVKVCELADYMITIENWTLELCHDAKSESFMNYLGLEMRLIIHKFSQKSQTRVELPNKFSPSLYRDDYCQMCI